MDGVKIGEGGQNRTLDRSRGLRNQNIGNANAIMSLRGDGAVILGNFLRHARFMGHRFLDS